MKEAKSKCFISLKEKLVSNPKEVWKYVKSNRKDEGGIPAISDGQGTVSDDLEKATCFNAYFHSVFSQPFNGAMPAAAESDVMPDIVISENGVFSSLQGLNPGAALGPDGISNHVLKNCARALTPFLVILFIKSLEAHELPREWKTANVVPIHKSGAKDSVMNYRPI